MNEFENNFEAVLQAMNVRLAALEQDNKDLRDVVTNIIGRFPFVEVGVNDLITDQIERFENERDSNGNLKYPCFPDVRQMMGELIAGGHSIGMKAAYAKAMQLNLDNLL